MTRWIFATLAAAGMLAMAVDDAAAAKRSGARSSHSGGANMMMGDGSVRFIRPGLGSGRRTGASPSKAYNPYVTVDFPKTSKSGGKTRSNLKQLGLPSFGYENPNK